MIEYAARLNDEDSPMMQEQQVQEEQQQEEAPFVSQEEETQQQDDDDNAYLVFTMVPRHQSLLDLIYEWRGMGEFNDGYGGIVGRDKKYGPKWRKHINSQHYPRTKRVAMALETYAATNKRDITIVCEQFQSLYEARKCSVSNLVTEFQQLGLITKKGARGRNNAN